MARALALIHAPLPLQECLRKLVVLGSAFALILAGKPFPF
jgi:hypothetical protein